MMRVNIIFEQLRISHWIKNFLIFLPMLFSGNIEIIFTFKAIILFLSFSFVASSVYCLNDIYDQAEDKKNFYKKKRPLVSKKLQIYDVIALIVICLITSFALLYFNNYLFGIYFLIFYFILTSCYTIFLKKLFLLDVFVLTSFYILRIYYGGILFDIDVTISLYLFSYSFFLGLSILKRISNEGYNQHLRLFKSIFFVSLLVSFTVLILYIFSDKPSLIYNNKNFLFPCVLILLIWVIQLYIDVINKLVKIDPVNYCIKSKKSWFLLANMIFFYYLSY